MVRVREMAADEWELMRDIRLDALREAPYAFASSYAREAAYDEEQWRGWFARRFVIYLGYHGASLDTEPAGLAGVFVSGGAADLVSMWVRPAARGQGVGEALVEASAAWAKTHSFDALFLWVTESNARALALYERCGFTPTGETQPLPSDPSLPEIQMRRKL
jgi:GNAT superfamily N-acetyltransferase